MQIEKYATLHIRLAGLKQKISALHSLSVGCETRNYCKMISKSDHACSHFPHNFQSSYEYLIYCQSETLKLSFLVKYHIGRPNYVDN